MSSDAPTLIEQLQNRRDHAARVCAELLATNHVREATRWAQEYRGYVAQIAAIGAVS